MSSRAEKIVNLALSSVENQAGLKNISEWPGYFASNPDSDSYVVENGCSTKLRLRKVCKNTYNDETISESAEDFSAGSSENYEPSSSDDSDTERSVHQELPYTSEAIECEGEDTSPSCKKSRTAKVIQAKRMGPPCAEKCVLQCSKKVSETYRAQVFKEYWEMATLQRQCDILGSCIEQLQLKYRRITAGVPRKPNCAFHLVIVIESRVSGTGMVVNDKRGKHGKHKKANEEVVMSVQDHINQV
ncbi:hypothetical protein CBL_05028 [Carabus blaptoides fortunei]